MPACPAARGGQTGSLKRGPYRLEGRAAGPHAEDAAHRGGLVDVDAPCPLGSQAVAVRYRAAQIGALARAGETA